jgi:predicted acylesterase/phospholipase RssA
MPIHPTPRRGFRAGAFAGLLLLCAGLLAATCGGGLRPDCPACAANALGPKVGCPFEATLSSMWGTVTDPTLLLLSGGGSHGAFGAGVLYGWGQQPPGPSARPKFTVVTGISTGALQATHAFLGNRDEELKHLFTQTSTGQIYTLNANPLGSNALQSRAPIKQLIDQYVTDDRILEVAAEADRELLVGTVNLDTSQFCPWNLSRVAKEAAAAGSGTPKQACYFDLFRDVIWAASGAPVVAPPVPIDAEACKTPTAPNPKAALHVDGGARLRVFVETLLAPTVGVAKIYVIVNGKVVLHPICVQNWIGAIALRALEMGDIEAMLGSLLYVQDQLSATWTLQLVRVPDDYCLDFPTSEFTPAKLTKLFQKGETWAQTLPWETAVPTHRVAPWPAGCPAALLRGCTP